MSLRTMSLREAKSAVRAFMQAHYTDERLAILLAYAQDGKLYYASCCCFIGIVTATLPLASHGIDHLITARRFDPYRTAEFGYRDLGITDDLRRRRLIPMIKAEMKRRERAAKPAPPVLVAV